MSKQKTNKVHLVESRVAKDRKAYSLLGRYKGKDLLKALAVEKQRERNL